MRAKFRAALAITIFSTILCASLALAQSYNVIIPSSGSIVLPVEPSRIVAHESEIRILFVHSLTFGAPYDWNLIAQTASELGVDIILMESTFLIWALYPSAYVPYGGDALGPAVQACHAQGIKLHVSMNMLLGLPGPEYSVIGPNLQPASYEVGTCPTKQVSRILIKNLVEELVTNYDIDGFMFDYIRYDAADVCYGPECKAKFEAYMGETITDWPGQFSPTGSRYDEFLDWRTHPINDLVRDVRSWMSAIRQQKGKPPLEFSGGVFQPLHETGLDAPSYWRKAIGQDWAYWVKEGWLDLVCPMIYVTDVAVVSEYVRLDLQYCLGGYPVDEMGLEGKVPLVPVLSNAWPGIVDPEIIRQQLNAIRAAGADGFCIWRYGGPGDNSGAPDIRNYLGPPFNLYPTFSMTNINASPGVNSCQITWTTDLPATSKVEFSMSPLFAATMETDPTQMDFPFWDVDHVLGTVASDSTFVTNHEITLTGLSSGKKYYFRVQSQDPNGIATSKVYIFEL